MDQLRQESLLEKMNNRPEKKRESKSEAAKIARYNIKLLESIYQAYDPEHADNVVKVFRKGGVFSVEPIMEEDFEESFDTQNDIESQGTTEVNAAALGGLGIVGDDFKNNDKDTNNNKDKNNGKDKNNDKNKNKENHGKGNKLGDIKEENSCFVDELYDDKTEDKGKFKGLNAADQLEYTGLDFDQEYQEDLEDQEDLENQEDQDDQDNQNDIFRAQNAIISAQNAKSGSKNAKFDAKNHADLHGRAKAPIALGLANAVNDGSGKNKDRYSLESSSDYDDETLGITMNPRRRRKKRKLKKKNQPINQKYKQLESIYGPNAIGSIRVSFSMCFYNYFTIMCYISR